MKKLGTLKEVNAKAGNKDPYLWAKEYAEKITIQEKEGTRTIMKAYSQNKLLKIKMKTMILTLVIFFFNIYIIN